MPRIKHLKSLKEVSGAVFFDAQAEECFRVLYALPFSFQFDVARFMVKRYLPVFYSHHPRERSVRSLINNPEGWIKEKGEIVPDVPGKAKGGDSHFINALYDLLFAVTRKNSPIQLTSACCSAILNSIAARMGNVWMADDPEAFKVWKSHPLEVYGRTMFANETSLAVSAREWNALYDELTKWSMSEFPEAPADELERHLKLWKDNDLLPISDSAARNSGIL